MKIAIVNGPNLNLLGIRETDIYGNLSFEAYLEVLKVQFPDVVFSYFQSNIEGVLIDALQKEGMNPATTGIVLNAGGYSHTSVALADAIAAIPCPVISVHISNIYAREPYRNVDLCASKALGQISGLGFNGYNLAVQQLILKNA